MRVLVVVFTGLALLAAQFAHGGILVPFLFAPSLLLVGVALLLGVGGQFKTSPPPLSQLLLAGGLAAYVLWRCATAQDQAVARIDAGHWLLGLGVWLAIALVASGRTTPLWVLGTILGSVAIAGGMAAFQIAQSDSSPIPFWFSEELRQIYAGRYWNRARGPFMNPNQLAWAANIGALLALGMGVWGRVSLLWRLVLLYFVVVFAGLTVFSASRGGLLSLAVGGIVFCGLSLLIVWRCGVVRRRGLILGVLSGVAVVLIGIGVLYSQNWVMQGRLDSLTDENLRSDLAKVAIRLFEQSPLLGAGPGTFVYAAREFRVKRNETDPIFAHDDWVQFLAEYGYVGMVLWLAFAAVIVGGALRALLAVSREAVEKRDQPMSLRGGLIAGSLAALAACLVHGFTDFNIHVPANFMIAAMVMGLLVSGRGRASGRVGMIAGRAASTVLAIAMVGLIGTYLWNFARSDYWGLRADNAYFAGHPGEAISFAERALAIAPDDGRVNRTIALSHFGFESARQFQDDSTVLIIDEDPVAPSRVGSDPRRTQGGRQKVRNEAALSALEVAIRAEPRERRNWIDAARVAADLDRLKLAREFARTAIRLDPSHATSWNNYAELSLAEGREADALRLFQIGMQLDGAENSSVAVEDLMEEMELEEGAR